MPWDEVLRQVAEAQAIERDDGAGATMDVLNAILAALGGDE